MLDNVSKIAAGRQAQLDMSAAYLVNVHSKNPDEVRQFIHDFRGAGCDLLRFTFPQPPRGIKTEAGVVPSNDELHHYRETLGPVIKSENSDECPILLVDASSSGSGP
ncbi:MAG TPA: hypothetical protein EYP98_19210 [Planctomycetes bacterium]|nr:hypothetical protein [Planctomycetota bacterium]